jgi:hypothetical protein
MLQVMQPTMLLLLIVLSALCHPNLLLQLHILNLKSINAFLQAVHLLLGADGELLDDFKEAPEAEDDDERGDFFEDAVQDDVDDETGHDDEGIKRVEVGLEVSGWGVSLLWERGCAGGICE